MALLALKPAATLSDARLHRNDHPKLSDFLAFASSRSCRAPDQPHEWWDNHRQNYKLYTSLVTQQEVASGDPVAAQRRLDSLLGIPLLAITPECEAIASAILASGLIPAKADRDALHIAVATFHQMNLLLTWNIRHIFERPCARRFTCAHRVSGLHSSHDLHTGGLAATIMNTSSTQDILAEVWAIKDSLSASHGHSLKATCRVMYAEQKKHPDDFVNLGASPKQNKTLETKGEVVKSPMTRKRRVRPARVSV